MADAQHLPHGRCQAGDRHSSSTRPGTASTQLGDSVSVSMHGSVSAESVVAGHHVLVVPSSYEGLGLQAIEAIGSGVPVVATATGGLVDTLETSRAGVLVEQADPTLFADALERLLTQPSVLEECRRKAMDYRSSGVDTWTFGVTAWDEIIQEVIGGAS